MCQGACPVGINTGDLVRRLRAEEERAGAARVWSGAAHGWAAATRAGSVALSAAKRTPAPLVTGVTRAARTLLGTDRVPLYDRRLPEGGAIRSRVAARAGSASGGRGSGAQPEAVFFSACIGTMFGPERGSVGATEAFLAVAARAGVGVVVPDGIDAMCCGTPWKSKGHTGGHRAMAERVLPALLDASDGGRLPIVSDAASCTEGLEALRDSAAGDDRYRALRFVDATQFVADNVLDRLAVTARKDHVVVHPTCSTTALGANAALESIAARIGGEVHVPDAWGCCAFAGDRGLLHPELTASATAAEAREVAAVDGDEYVSANRTCELGMARATGKPYRHVLEALEEATR
jgi:D-lactate dehydrogenase